MSYGDSLPVWYPPSCIHTRI
jgi:hypothetical protein